mmetsp:Transcript_28290/g.40433  ORF Transcript_28290/g.40433 Transcript_28290/m.40433 type:complete len:252 (+) Transcript_28290:210-965(+)|eukprot:CAMPEP_0201689062 /NCGR_PEP_ID=MMETSP0578-20130828/2722_1 /ASSEMBLY_ACC=CAM_ASM_000663 /TAXON_ID=267565 /ORGANISM="Skeletonema grethea, Strain CCMP 1804" /LENGTH=251 /DNA_ID=CAMNT_0048173581 /DNA_START=134 /DNA_END=889 /DNA_ORIENTATION=+
MMLGIIQAIDETLGLSNWSSRQVAIITAITLGLLYRHEKWGIRWYSLLHAILSGYLSLICVWTSYHHAPSSATLCDGPLTSLHRITPAITLGYGLFDILEATVKSLPRDFLLHGFATFGVMVYFCEYHIPEIVLPFLLMEISTVHLVFMKATNLSEQMIGVNLAMFVLTFFLFRLMVCPYLWWGIVRTTFAEEEVEGSMACLPWHFKYFWLLFGLIFNGLNSYWGVKIILKVLRKATGKEKMKEGNALKDS